MENQLFQDYKEGAERKAMLEANCRKTETKPVKKYLSPEESAQLQREFIEDRAEIARLTAELDRKRAEINGKMKPLVKDSDYKLHKYKTGYVEVDEQVYLFDDQDSGMMGTYDKDGNLIESRRLLPDEKQTNVVSMARAAGQ